MSRSTNKSTDDRERKSFEEEHLGKYTIDNDPSKRGEPAERGREIERKVSKRTKK